VTVNTAGDYLITASVRGNCSNGCLYSIQRNGSDIADGGLYGAETSGIRYFHHLLIARLEVDDEIELFNAETENSFDRRTTLIFQRLN